MTKTLKIKDLCVEVEGKRLLNHVNLTIPAGEVHALLGPNGCGKTTLMMTIMGYSQYQVVHGHIFLHGKEITALGITERARLGIGLAHQRPPTIAGVTLQRLLDYFAARSQSADRQRDALVQDFQMQLFLARAINAQLSGGEIKRSELFQLLTMAPTFAMLDEPDSGIDLESLALVGCMVNRLLTAESSQREKKAALIITHTGHILDAVAADQAHIMLQGSIAYSGEPQVILAAIRRYGFEGCVEQLRSGVRTLT
jgi:Fe-S cluster assembly ATP-binding protein